jgi:hypothetical protein
MHGQLLITHLVSNVFKVSVTVYTVGRGWNKLYSSKRECLTELRRLGLISSDAQKVASRSNLIMQDGIALETSVFPIALVGADFIETSQDEIH